MSKYPSFVRIPLREEQMDGTRVKMTSLEKAARKQPRSGRSSSSSSLLVHLDGAVGRIWPIKPKPDTRTGELTRFTTGSSRSSSKSSSTLTNRRSNLCPTPFNAVAISENADWIAAVDATGRIYLLNVMSNSWSCIGSKSCAGSAAAFSPAINTTNKKSMCGDLLIGFEDGTILVYSIYNSRKGSGTFGHELLATFRGHRCKVTSLTFDPSGNILFSCSVDNVMLWDLKTRRKLRELGGGPSGAIHAASFPQGDRIATVVKDGSLWLWDAETLALIDRIGNSDIDHHHHHNNNNNKNASGDESTDTHSLKIFKEVANLSTSICISQDGVYVLICSPASREIKVVNTHKSKIVLIVSLPSPATGAYKALFIRDSYNVLVLCNDGTTRILDIAQHNKFVSIFAQTGNRYFGESFAVDSRATYMLTTTSDGMMRLYDFRIMTSRMKAIESLQATQHGIDSSMIMKELNGQNKEDMSESKSTHKKKAMPSAHTKKKNVTSDHTNSEMGNSPRDIRLSKIKLDALLKTHGEFPAKYRCMIWRFLLEVPLNKAAFSIVSPAKSSSMSTTTPTRDHIEFWQDLPQLYPLQNTKLATNLQTLLVSLSRWCELFSQVSFMPQFVFPFVRLFDNDTIACFETVATIILNECFSWFEMFPYHPVKVLSRLEKVLVDEDYPLYAKLHELFYSVTAPSLSAEDQQQQKSIKKSMNYGPQLMLWTLMKTLMTDVLRKEDWLKVMDMIIHQISYGNSGCIGYIALSFLMSQKDTLMHCRSEDELLSLLHRQHAVSIHEIMRRAQKLMKKYNTVSSSPSSSSSSSAKSMRVLGQQQRADDDTFCAYTSFSGFFSTSAVTEAARLRGVILEEEEELQQRRTAMNDDLVSSSTCKNINASAAVADLHKNFITEKMQLEQLGRAKKAQEKEILGSLAEERRKLAEIEKETRARNVKDLESNLAETMERERHAWAHHAEECINELKEAKRESVQEIMRRKEESDKMKTENESLVAMLKAEEEMSRDARLRRLDDEVKTSIKTMQMKQGLANVEAELDKKKFDAIRLAHIRDANIRSSLEQERAARSKLEQEIVENALTNTINSSKADIERKASMIQIETEEALKHQRDNQIKREEVLEMNQINLLKNQLFNLERMHKSVTDDAIKQVHEQHEQARKDGIALQDKMTKMERDARFKMYNLEMVKASDAMEKQSEEQLRKAYQLLQAGNEAKLKDELMMKDMLIREKMIKEQLNHEKHLIDVAYRVSHKETEKFNELRREIMERRIEAETEDMKKSSQKMKELSVEKQKMLIRMEEESRVRAQMREIEAMRKDAIQYEKLRVARSEAMHHAEESLIFAQPMLRSERGGGSGTDSDNLSSANTSLKESENSSDYELTSVSDGNTDKTEETDEPEGVNSSDSTVKEKLMQSPTGGKVVDVLKHYLEVEDEGLPGQEGGGQGVEESRQAILDVEEDEIRESEGRDAFYEATTSPAIHAEARELIRKHIAQRGRNPSMITHAGSDSD